MHLSPTDRARWPSWLAVVPVALGAAAWWWLMAPGEPAPAAASREPVTLAAAHRAPASVPALELVATRVGGAASVAMLRVASDPQPRQVRVGDSVEGLVVTEIAPERVSFTGPGGRVVIGGVTAAAPVAAAPPQRPVPDTPPPRLIPTEQLPAAYRGPAPEDEVLGH